MSAWLSVGTGGFRVVFGVADFGIVSSVVVRRPGKSRRESRSGRTIGPTRIQADRAPGSALRHRLLRSQAAADVPAYGLGPNRLFPQDLLQRLALPEFIDELVEIADLPHQRVLDFIHPDAAHHALDQRRVRVELRCFGGEGFEVVVRSDLPVKTLGAVSG